MRNLRPLLSLLLTIGLYVHASNPIKPTTTLAAETGNNTSAASTFTTQTNGNAGAGNVSKVPIRTLLYAGSTTKVYAHWMPWFGTTSHMNVGYSSTDPSQVAKQVADMASRGIDGAIVDWYGPNNTHNNTATIYLMQSAQANGTFTFAITEDVGALKACANTAGCDVTAQCISDLTYAYNTFEGSPAYVRIGGRPVVFFFGTEAYPLDWTRIRAGTPGNPLFIFRNSGAFAKAQSNGGFSWVGLSSDPTNMGLGYLDNFYATALTYPYDSTFGSAYKGFNDTLASWGSNRILNQQCGQTWLTTLAEAGRYYSTSNQLQSMQMVTWNDYEEGTEIETGIDNCVSVSGSAAGNTVYWSIAGQENTVDHYTVFISLDGQNLMPVADVPAGTHSLDLSQFSFDPANYTLYLKAVGKPTLTNKMSAAIPWTLADNPPVAKLTVTPLTGIAPLTVTADASASTAVDGTIASTSIDFGDGTVAGGATASHSYAGAGTYTVTASVTDSFGGVSRSSATVSVAANQPPLARLSVTPSTGVAPVTVTADTSASSDPDGKVVSTSINFGDGTVVSGVTASHTYSAAGTYTVTAIVTDDRGASSSATASVTVSSGNKPPVVTVTAMPGTITAGMSVTANASASDSDGTIASFNLNWGDGTAVVSPASAVSHVYTRAGTYTITATATDNQGATTKATTNVVVNWGVVVTNPVPGVYYTSPVHVVAMASSSAPITCIKIYLDSNEVYSMLNVSQIDTYIRMSKGTHLLVVQAWDANGLIYKNSQSIQVSGTKGYKYIQFRRAY